MEQLLNSIFFIPTGRKIILSELRLTQTYKGCLEGTAETNSKFIRHRIRKESGKYLSNTATATVVVLDNGEATLPSFQWLAEFWCREAVHTSDADYSSRLFVCWFTDDIPNSLTDALQAVVDTVDYDANAEDYDIMP